MPSWRVSCPPDPSGGGAVEADAHVYIDHAPLGPYAKYLAMYRSGLAAIRSFAKKRGAAGPQTLPPSQLDALLIRMENGATAEFPSRSPMVADGGKTFFRLPLQHTLEDTFGDPIHGGNYDYLGWQLIG